MQQGTPLDVARVRREARTRTLLRPPAHLVYLAATPSTNTEARALSEDGAPHGTVVVADDQTAGRGRLGRSWSVPPRTGLTLSVIVHPPAASAGGLPAAPLVVMATALAVYDLARHDAGVAGQLKWPNDLLIEGRKACGILVEAAGRAGGTAPLIVGIGLNVNAAPPGLEERATCLAAARGALLDRSALLAALLGRLDGLYEQAWSAGPTVWQRWRAALTTLGQRVTVHLPGGSQVTGVAEDVTTDGALCLREATGRRHILHAGEVSLSPSQAPPHP